jgi:inosine-uridine nucleoside N-ribohydrolase
MQTVNNNITNNTAAKNNLLSFIKNLQIPTYVSLAKPLGTQALTSSHHCGANFYQSFNIPHTEQAAFIIVIPQSF